MVNLTTEQVLTMSPDASSTMAGQGLANPGKWVTLGRNSRSVWGECQGSGKNPYRTQADLNGPAFNCSCPSRKFPCKHGLGLLLLMAAQTPVPKPILPELLARRAGSLTVEHPVLILLGQLEERLITRPEDTIFVLISDLIEGGNKDNLYKRVASIAASGARMITLLALDDLGSPCFDHEVAANFSALGVPSFACTPDLFPDLMANALQCRDINQWAATQGITVEREEPHRG